MAFILSESKPICTICLIESSEMNTIFNDNEIFVKITECFGQEIIIASLVKTICKLCVKKIEDVYTFRHLIIRNQNILLNRLKNNHSLVEDVKSIKEETELENKEIDFKKFNVKVELNENEGINENKSDFSEVEDMLTSDAEDNLSLSLIKKSKKIIHKNKKYMKKHSRTSSKENVIVDPKTHRCLTCFKLYSTQIDLVRHYNEEHKNKPQGDTMQEAKDLVHEIVADDNGCVKYKCRKCAKLFESKSKINKHTISHINERPFVCKLCGRTYKVASEIVRHGRAHSGLKVPCKFQCGYSTSYLGALKQHERRHTREYMYKCDKCGKGFEVLTWYEQHQNIHTGAKPYVCVICGVAFHMDRYLKVHISTVHPQANSHKRFLCVHCSKPCGSKKGLTLHLKEHGITSKFLCDMCGKVLSDSRQLKLHKRIHLGDRPYSCSTCNKSFTKRFNLTVHARTHSGERLHACSRCGKRYIQKGTLLRHIQRFHKGNSSLEVSRNEP